LITAAAFRQPLAYAIFAIFAGFLRLLLALSLSPRQLSFRPLLFAITPIRHYFTFSPFLIFSFAIRWPLAADALIFAD